MSEQGTNLSKAGIEQLLQFLLETGEAALRYKKLDAEDLKDLRRGIDAIRKHQGPLMKGLLFIDQKFPIPTSLDRYILNLLLAAYDIGKSGNVTASAKAFVVEEGQRARGVKSGEAARKKAAETWEPHAREIAVAVRKEQSGSSQEMVADEIGARWKDPHQAAPTHRTLVRFISRLERNGELPPRAGSCLT